MHKKNTKKKQQHRVSMIFLSSFSIKMRKGISMPQVPLEYHSNFFFNFYGIDVKHFIKTIYIFQIIRRVIRTVADQRNLIDLFLFVQNQNHQLM